MYRPSRQQPERRLTTFFPSIHSKTASFLAVPILCAGVMAMAQNVTAPEAAQSALAVNVPAENNAEISRTDCLF